MKFQLFRDKEKEYKFNKGLNGTMFVICLFNVIYCLLKGFIDVKSVLLGVFFLILFVINEIIKPKKK